MVIERLKQLLWRWRGVLIATPAVTLAVLALRFSGFFQPLELYVLDRLFLLRPREPMDDRIVIVTIDEQDVQNVGQWPMSDAKLALLLNSIKRQQPRAIGLDIYRDLVVNPGHENLVKVFESTPNLIGVQKVGRDAVSVPVNPPPILKERNQVGSNDLPLDPGGVVRRGVFYLSTEDGGFLFSFALRLADLYLQKEGITIEQTDDHLIKVGSKVIPLFQANTGGYVGADANGYQVLLNYRGTIRKFPTVSMTAVLTRKVPPDLMRDRVVLVGSTAESLKDIFFTSYERMAGVAIHANLLSEILSVALDNRPVLRTWPDPIEALWVFVWSAIGAYLTWKLRPQEGSRHQHAIPGFVAIALAVVVLLGVGYGSFTIGWWLPTPPALIGLLGSSVAITAYLASSAAELRKTFGRYLTNEVVASLLESPSGLKLGGELRKVTIMMSDLRGFSAMSGQLPPETVVKILNFYLEAMTDTITQFNGTINEIMGDGIFVMFGAPTYREDDAQRAIACALGMELAMVRVNQHNKEMGYPRLDMGIGINTGEVVAGNIGSQKRAKYTVVGNDVNLASRVESYTVGGQILISEATYHDATRDHPEILKVRGQLKVAAKGIKEPITLYDIGGIGAPYNLYLPEEQENFVILQPELVVKYVVLEGKHMVGKIFRGRISQLSEQGAIIHLEQFLDTLTNLKINILLEPDVSDAEVAGDLYGKVMEKIEQEAQGTSSAALAEAGTADHVFRIRFTAIPTALEAVLTARRSTH